MHRESLGVSSHAPRTNMSAALRLSFLLTTAIFLCGVAVAAPDDACPSSSKGTLVYQVSIRSARNSSSGEWVTRLEGAKEADNRTDSLEMDFKQQVTECGEKRSFRFEGIFGGKPAEERDRLRFHPKCGKNVGILSNGRTIEKLNGEERLFGVAYTNRPLRLNELFEVVIEKKTGSKFNYYMGIGITTTSPDDGDIPSHINSLKAGTWVLYHNQIYNNGNLNMNNRKRNLDQLKVGDRVGLMRSDLGTLLLFVNGEEEAIASNTPYPVYGVFECYGDPIRVTLTS